MINTIKKSISNSIGKKIIIKVYACRNKMYQYEGIIENAYNNIFTIIINKENNREIKSFNYVDVLIGNIKIKIK